MERVFLRPSHLFCSRGRQTLNVAPPISRRAKTASTDRPWLLALHSALLLTRPARSPRPLRPARPFSFTLSPPRPLSIFIPHRLRYRLLFLACRGRLLCFASTMPFLLLLGRYHPSANGGYVLIPKSSFPPLLQSTVYRRGHVFDRLLRSSCPMSRISWPWLDMDGGCPSRMRIC